MRRPPARRSANCSTYHRALAAELHAQCRVHTYGSFHIADLAAELAYDVARIRSPRPVSPAWPSRSAARDHAARMESFYAGQAEAYDSFRDGLLQGRRELYSAIPCPTAAFGSTWAAAPAANLELLGDRIGAAAKGLRGRSVAVAAGRWPRQRIAAARLDATSRPSRPTPPRSARRRARPTWSRSPMP